MKIMPKWLLLLSLATTPLYASQTDPVKLSYFRISSGDMMYMYWNDANTPKQIRLLVDSENDGKPADTVTLDCNGHNVYVAPGGSATCDVAAHRKVSFTIPKNEFKNGAFGESRRWY